MGILKERITKRDRDLADRSPRRTPYGCSGLTLLEKGVPVIHIIHSGPKHFVLYDGKHLFLT
jgi:hypothetical protein